MKFRQGHSPAVAAAKAGFSIAAGIAPFAPEPDFDEVSQSWIRLPSAGSASARPMNREPMWLLRATRTVGFGSGTTQRIKREMAV